MITQITFNGVSLECEHTDMSFVKTAKTRCGDDIMPILTASMGLYGEVVRLVKEANKKDGEK